MFSKYSTLNLIDFFISPQSCPSRSLPLTTHLNVHAKILGDISYLCYQIPGNSSKSMPNSLHCTCPRIPACHPSPPDQLQPGFLDWSLSLSLLSFPNNPFSTESLQVTHPILSLLCWKSSKGFLMPSKTPSPPHGCQRLPLCPVFPLPLMPAGPHLYPTHSSQAGFLSAPQSGPYLGAFGFAIPVWNILSPTLEFLATPQGTAVSHYTVGSQRAPASLQAWGAPCPLNQDTKFANTCHRLSLMQGWQMLKTHPTQTHHYTHSFHVHVGPDSCLEEFSFGESDAVQPSFRKHFQCWGTPHSEHFDRRPSPPSHHRNQKIKQRENKPLTPSPSSKGCEHKIVVGPPEAPSHQGLEEEE